MLKLLRIKFYNLPTRTTGKNKNYSTSFSKKIHGAFIEKPKNYLKIVAKDYKDVAISLREDMKEKPFKSACVISGIGFLMLCLKTNPNEQSFRAKHIQCANEVSLVHSNVVNPNIVEHLTYIQQCYNKDLLRYKSLGLFSIIWIDNYSKEAGIYETKCSYLQLRYRNFMERIIDVGFLNIWWVMSRKMLNYDINY